MSSKRKVRGLLVLVGAMALSIATSAGAAGLHSSRISVPKGPASIEGLGSSFAPSLASGTASYRIEIAVPPAARGFAPALAIEYDGGAGVSELGLGFRISGIPSVRRRTEASLPKLAADDTWELTGFGPPSELLELPGGYLRPRYEYGAFVRVQRALDGESYEARAKSGVTYRFGGEGFTEQDERGVATYLLREQVDLHGHVIRYEWDTTEGHALLTRVVWNDFGPSVRQELHLEYEDRPDVHELFGSGIRKHISRRLVSLRVELGGELVRRYVLDYAPGSPSLLQRVSVLGNDDKTALPPVTFAYTDAFDTAAEALVTVENPPGRDFNAGEAAFTDLNGDALPDLLVTTPGAFRSYVNLDGARFATGKDWAPGESPSTALGELGATLADLDGDAAADLVLNPVSGALRYFPGRSELAFGDAVEAGSAGVPLNDPDVRLVDLDGDRRSDVLYSSASGLYASYNRADGFTFMAPLPPLPDGATLRFAGGAVELCDVNGDRVEDLCLLRSGAFVYYLGRGYGAFEPAREGSGVPPFERSSPADAFRLVDLNGDGWVDLVRVGVYDVEVALAEAEGSFAEPRVVSNLPGRASTAHVEFSDMNASGSTDIVWYDPSEGPEAALRYLELFPAGRAGLLASIDNGIGKVTRITYASAASFAARARSAGQPWSSRMNLAMPVVARVEVDASLGDPPLVTEYAYGEGTWDAEQRTFAGFGHGVETAIGDDFTPTLVTTTTFDLGLELRVLRGVTLTQQTADTSGSVFSESASEHRRMVLATAARGGVQVEYAYRSSLASTVRERRPDSERRTTFSEWEQDPFGNVIEERHWGEVRGAGLAADGDEAYVSRAFASDEEQWLLGYVTSEELRNADGERLSMTRSYYDGEPFVGLELGRVERGDVTRREVWVGPELDAFVLEIGTRYDGHGLPVETRDARGGGRHFGWDVSDHTTLESEAIKLDSSIQLIERVETDRRYGAPLVTTAYNGSKTRFRYDALGRLTAVFQPGDADGEPTTTYEYQVDAPLSRVVTTARVGGSAPDERSETLVDGLGRTRGSLTRAEEGRWVLAGVELFDARGNARRSLRPRFVAERDRTFPPLLADAPGVEAWHDALGRNVRTRSELGVETRIDHLPFETQSYDGGQTSSEDGYERTPRITRFDAFGRAVSASVTLDGKPASATFSYDAAGRLLSRVDPEGHRYEYEYDGRGLRTAVHDPDTGEIGFVYDAAGNVIERRHADGASTHYAYDLAGRLISEDWMGDDEPEVEHTWDRAPEGHEQPALFLGKMGAITTADTAVRFSYDARGRVVNTNVTANGESYDSGSRFDNLDRENEHVYPDGTSVRIARNSRGQLAGYGNLVSFDYGEDGLELERRFGNGVVQRSAYDTDRRLESLEVVGPQSKLIEHLEWRYDSAGNVRSVADLRPRVTREDDRSETYRYDNLYRLTHAQGSWGQTEWAYSSAGRLLSRVSNIPGQNAPSIDYAASRPHAPIRIGGRAIEYDARGRMKTDGERTYHFDATDQLVRVETREGALQSNIYDGEGTRRVRIEQLPDGTERRTLFVSAWEEVENGKIRRYVVHAGRRIARLGDALPAEPSLSVPPRELGEWGSPSPLLRASFAFARMAQWLITLLMGVGVFVWTRRRLARLALVFVPAALLFATACGTASKPAPPPSDEPRPHTVETLTQGDSVLVTDPLGSLLAEVGADGEVTGRFAAYPYGLTRYDTSSATDVYAGSPRDKAIGLDHMGARHYAPDLGLWTAPDPVHANDPERLIGTEFGAANPYGYANQTPIIAADQDGHFWHIVAGAAIGAVIGGGIEAVRQYAETGKVEDWGRVAMAAGGGAVSGAVTAACPTAGITSVLAVGAASTAAGGVTERLIASGGSSAGTVQDVATDALQGAATAGVASKVVGPVVKAVKDRLPSLKARLAAMFRPEASAPIVGRSVGSAACISTRSAIQNSPYAMRLAQNLGQQAQRDVDGLLAALRAGNTNPGIGTRSLGSKFFELRGANAGRVIIHQDSANQFTIVGKFQAHVRGDTANSNVINRLISESGL